MRKILDRSTYKIFLLAYLVSVPLLAFGQQVGSPSLSAQDQVQDCLRGLWGKPVFWDQAAVTPVDPSLCKAQPEKIDEALRVQHVMAFHLSNALLLIQDASFDKNNAPFNYLWKTPTINMRVIPRSTPGSRPPTDAELLAVTDTVLKNSHLVPLTCPFKASEGGMGRLALNLFIEIRKMHPGAQQESVIALLADSDADHETVLGVGRLVYGELRDGHLQFRWESPLLETSMSQVGLVDLLRNGNLQIILTSNFGMGNHTAFYAFDLDGTEISRQTSTCGMFDDLARHSATACPITTEDGVDIRDSSSGPKELIAVDESGKKARYVFENARYKEVEGPKSARRPSVPRATTLNAAGLKLMQVGDYQAAIVRFEEAAQLDSSDPLFANNAGFAYYELGKYDESLYWFNKTIEIDPNRGVAYLNLGDAYAKLDRNAEARQAYIKYIQLAPNSKSVPAVRKKLEDLARTP